jgi:7-carboxy-7-deazaguanine synthase
MDQALRISEIFYSLQGETNTVGIPTVFVRLTGCPLRCSYCDTEYAFTGGEKFSQTEIISKIQAFNCQYVTITGGEPLAQPGCNALMVKLLDLGFLVSLETSGALDVSAVDPRVVKVMDLKTPSSGEIQRNRYANIEHLTVQDQVKFVIADDVDYQWSKQQMIDHQLLDRCQVLFSPVMGVMPAVELAEKILADQLAVRFQIQLHKYLWNDARGK